MDKANRVISFSSRSLTTKRAGDLISTFEVWAIGILESVFWAAAYVLSCWTGKIDPVQGIVMDSFSVGAVIFLSYLVSLLVCLFFPGNQYIPNNTKIEFYDEYLIISCTAAKATKWSAISLQTTRRMKYSDISKCVLDEKCHRLSFRGFGTETRQIEKQYLDGHGGHKKITESKIEGSVSYWTMLADNIDFKTEIEKYSPLKVKIQ